MAIACSPEIVSFKEASKEHMYKFACLGKPKRMKFDDLIKNYLGEFGRYQKLQFFLVCLPTIFTAMHALSWTFTAANVPHRYESKCLNSCRCRLRGESPNTTYWLPSNKWSPNVFNKTDCDREAHSHWVDCPYESCKLNKPVDSCPNGYVFDLSRIHYSAIYRVNSEVSLRLCLVGDCLRSAGTQGRDSVHVLCGADVGLFDFRISRRQVDSIKRSSIEGFRIGRKKVFFIAILIQIVSGIGMAVAPDWQIFSILRIGVGLAHPGIWTNLKRIYFQASS